MSDLAAVSQFAESTAQLPVNWYLDPGIFELEQKLLFNCGPGYMGHELMVPNAGDYHSLSWMDHAKVLVRNQEGIHLISNVCRHRQAIMLQGRGNAKNIVCPVHRWTYDLKGELLGAPHFPSNPCLNLQHTPLQRWNGLLFSGPRAVSRDLAGFAGVADFDFGGFMLDRVELHECDYNWKTFIEVYLEDYHVVPFHPGLGSFVTCDDLKWEFGEWASLQSVGINSRLAKAGTPVYRKWQEQVLKYTGGKLPKHGAIWMVYYPNIMIEWYPHVLVISTLVPSGPQKTTNVVEFYYPEDIVLFERDFVAAEQAAYMETAIEDDEIGLRMDRGRKALAAQGISQVGPYQSPMEDGMQHFHEFLRREIEPHLGH
jgi:phenylpropionate dioxygenase-like ring-hydroxylating dioxygenase large terminal subunit